ncbi:MAG: periplasmic heavy metal sensor [Gemmatimonadetes bacterium]|nr:periplasmic heavy metal sensor [Gemmatimonadota bacterium]
MFSTSKLWAIGLLAAIGVAGFASGAATMNYVGERGGRTGGRCSYSGMLRRDLSLTAAQDDSVRAIMRRHRAEMRAAFETVRPQTDLIRARIRDEIRAVLTPSQQAAFRELTDRERAERARHDSAAPAGRAP